MDRNNCTLRTTDTIQELKLTGLSLRKAVVKKMQNPRCQPWNDCDGRLIAKIFNNTARIQKALSHHILKTAHSNNYILDNCVHISHSNSTKFVVIYTNKTLLYPYCA